VVVGATEGAALADAVAAGVVVAEAAGAGVALAAAFGFSFIPLPRCCAWPFAGAEALDEAAGVSAVFAPVAVDLPALGAPGEFGADAGMFAGASSFFARSFV